MRAAEGAYNDAMGVPEHLSPARELYEPGPWLTDHRDARLFIDPFAISGRELHEAEPDWPFHPGDYM